jgi:cytochrome c oxidase assembly protein subunit 15
LLTAWATFPLLFIGGLVTSKGAGLAVPDWPTTFGYNPFLYPWSKMAGDIFYEHSHRLVASAVGILTILLTLALWLQEKRGWLRWLGATALGLIIIQGVIGGLRVVLMEQTLAIIHACMAQAFFALTVSLVLFTSEEWRESPQVVRLSDAARIQRLCLLTTGMIYLQAIFGAVLRHTGARLDLHLLLAALVALHVVMLGARILRGGLDRRRFLRPAALLNALLWLQLALGLASYLGKFVMTLPGLAVVVLGTSHVVTGALLLATGLVLTLRSYRHLALPEPLPGREFIALRGAEGSRFDSAHRAELVEAERISA